MLISPFYFDIQVNMYLITSDFMKINFDIRLNFLFDDQIGKKKWVKSIREPFFLFIYSAFDIFCVLPKSSYLPSFFLSSFLYIKRPPASSATKLCEHGTL